MLKTIPYYFYQVDAIEDWLDEQAQKGLSRWRHASAPPCPSGGTRPALCATAST